MESNDDWSDDEFVVVDPVGVAMAAVDGTMDDVEGQLTCAAIISTLFKSNLFLDINAYDVLEMIEEAWLLSDETRSGFEAEFSIIIDGLVSDEIDQLLTGESE
jgi:hypothetical protein